MAVSQEDILNAIAEMSVKDVVELVEAMEEKFAIAGVGNRISRGDNAAKNRSIANDVCVMHYVCGASSVTRQLA